MKKVPKRQGGGGGSGGMGSVAILDDLGGNSDMPRESRSGRNGDTRRIEWGGVLRNEGF